MSKNAHSKIYYLFDSICRNAEVYERAKKCFMCLQKQILVQTNPLKSLLYILYAN